MAGTSPAMTGKRNGHGEGERDGEGEVDRLMSQSVIPGRTEGANPESRWKYGACFWIPGSLVTLAPRNDKRLRWP
jgi:hypothetical protein